MNEELRKLIENDFRSRWQHWQYLADFRGGVNFNHFRRGIESVVKDLLEKQARKFEQANGKGLRTGMGEYEWRGI